MSHDCVGYPDGRSSADHGVRRRDRGRSVALILGKDAVIAIAVIWCSIAGCRSLAPMLSERGFARTCDASRRCVSKSRKAPDGRHRRHTESRARAIPRRRTGRTAPSCASRTGSASRRRSRAAMRETQRDRARERPAHRVRGGRLPEHRRVLGEEARDLHDHGRHLHARLRVLQREDRPAGRARSRRARSMSPRRSRSSASTTSSSPRSIATISPTAARGISPQSSARSAPRRRQPPSRC